MCGDSISKILAQQAERHAEKPALLVREKWLSYSELYQRASSFAKKLIDIMGPASPDKPEPIALLMGHDIETIIAIYAVILSGRCYTPLDPTFPPARLLKYVSGSGASVIITQSDYRELAEQLAENRCRLVFSSDYETSGFESAIKLSDLPGESTGKSPAYLLYTSGTTGEPKGVWHTQKSLIRAAGHYRNDLTITPDDKVALILPINYTPSVFCIFGALLAGATLCPFDVKHNTGQALIDWIEEANISLLYSTPTLFRRLINHEDNISKLATLRSVQLAGETVYRADIEAYKQHFADLFSVYNGMGTTETSCLARYVISKDDFEGDVVPIGQPYDDVKINIVDENGTEVPPGQAGEMLVSGVYLAEGYWGQPQLTADKFVPIEEDPKVIQYRTGDLVRRIPSGDIVHIGRIDSQVKLNGQRIELDEIEKTILHMPSIREAVVLYIKPEDSKPFLAAFFAPKIENGALREYLCSQLPPYMVPTRLVSFDHLPLTQSGKVDRFLLSQFDFESLEVEQDETYQKNPIDMKVLACFRETLENPDIDFNTDFFHAGGNSMTGIELAILLEKTLGVQLNASALIESPTPRLVSKLLQSTFYDTKTQFMFRFLSSETQNNMDDDAVPIFCFPGRGGGALTFLALSQSLGVDHPVYSFEYGGSNDDRYWYSKSVDRLANLCFESIVEAYPEGPIALTSFSLGGVIAFDVAHKLRAAGREIALFAMLDCYSPNRMRLRFMKRRFNRKTFRKVVGSWVANLRSEQDTQPKLSHNGDDKKLMDSLETAVFLYKARPLALEKTLLMTASERSWVARVFDSYAQWYGLIRGPIQRFVIEGDHEALIKRDQTPKVASLIQSSLPNRGAKKRQIEDCTGVIDLWSYHKTPVPSICKITADQLPKSQQSLLNSSSQLTKPLSQRVNESLKPKVKNSTQNGRHYYRKVILTTAITNRPAVYAVLRIAMDKFTPEVRKLIIDLQHPFGEILTRSKVAYHCKLLGLFRMEPNEDLRRELQSDIADAPFFGRHNLFMSSDEQVLAEVIEVLPTWV